MKNIFFQCERARCVLHVTFPSHTTNMSGGYARLRRDRSFMDKPDSGWLHHDDALQAGEEGIFYSFPVTVCCVVCLCVCVCVSYVGGSSSRSGKIEVCVCVCVCLCVCVCVCVCVCCSSCDHLSLSLSLSLSLFASTAAAL